MAVRAESATLSLLESDDDDDIVIVHDQPAVNRTITNNINSLLLPRPRLMSRHIHSVTPEAREANWRSSDRLRNRPRSPVFPQPNAQRPPLLDPPMPPLILPGQQQQQQQQEQQQQQQPAAQTTAVIDLTDEPDSPVQTRPQLPRNPRRTGSQRGSAPALVRSDGSAIPHFVTTIDLTVDSPEDERSDDQLHHHHRTHYSRRRRTHHHQNGPDFAGSIGLGSSLDTLINWDLGSGLVNNLRRGLAHYLGSDVPPPMNHPFAFSRPNLDVSRPAWEMSAPAAEPKPPLEPVPPPREGFTRDTCANPEEGSPEAVVICPACKEELAYDPTDSTSSGAPVGTKKRKRAPGEHHFWALKKCGHVYCADCFENRRPTKMVPHGAGFPGGNTSADLQCAVDGCETKVSQKSEWVGIFL